MVMPLMAVQRFSLNSFGVAPLNDFRGILNSSFRAAPFKGISNSSSRAVFFKGILYSSLRAAPFEGISNSSSQAVPFKGILYSSLRAAPFKGISNSSFQATPYEGISYCSSRAMPLEGIFNGSFGASPFEGIPYCSFGAAPSEGIPYCSSRAMPLEGISVQTVPFKGTIYNLLPAPAFRGVLYCPLWVSCLNNIQGITSAFSFCECGSLLSAYWYFENFVAQLMEVIWSYFSPVIIFLIEFLQKITVWYNEFMWHWFERLEILLTLPSFI